MDIWPLSYLRSDLGAKRKNTGLFKFDKDSENQRALELCDPHIFPIQKKNTLRYILAFCLAQIGRFGDYIKFDANTMT